MYLKYSSSKDSRGMTCASHSEATHVDDEGKVVWIWYEMLLKENNKPKETELY